MSKTIPRAQGYNYNLNMKSPFNFKNQSTQPVAGSKLGSRIYQSKLESRLLNNSKTIDVNNDDKDGNESDLDDEETDEASDEDDKKEN